MKENISKLHNNFAIKVQLCSDYFMENKEKWLWLFGITYRVLLDIYYIVVIGTTFNGDGLVCNPSMTNYVVSWLAYIIGYRLILGVKDYLMSVFLHLQWILTITPLFVIYAMQNDKSTVYVIFVLSVVILQALIGKRNNEKKCAISFNNGKVWPYVKIMCYIIIGAVWVIMMLWNDFAGMAAFDLKYIYEMREKLVYPPMFRYIVSWIVKAIIPWFFMTGLSEKKIFRVIYSVSFQVLFYMILGFKGPFLMMAIVLVVYILSKYKVLLLGSYIGLQFAVILGSIGHCLEKIGTGKISILFNSLLGERTLFIPALFKFQFYEVFSRYPKVCFSDGMIGRFFSQTYLYKNSLGYTVYAYFNNGTLLSESNTGYLGDSYAQMGIVGMLLIGIAVILTIKFLTNFEQHIAPEILCCMVACICISLNDGAFFTSLFTGGIWILLLLLILYTRRGEKNDRL